MARPAGIARDAAGKAVATLFPRLNAVGAIVVHDSHDTLPAGVLAEARRQGIDPRDIEGVYSAGWVHVNRAAIIPTTERLAEALRHEAAGHYGLRLLRRVARRRDGDGRWPAAQGRHAASDRHHRLDR